MQNSHEKTRREFLKTSAKIVGGAATLGLGANLFAQSGKTAKEVVELEESEATKSVVDEVMGLQEALKGEKIPSIGYAAHSKEWKFKPFKFSRHALGANDVLLDILYTGICHSDLHAVSGDHHKPTYPIVPGHEILGRVVAVGSKVSKFKVGDYAGVGCMVNSCGKCEACKQSKEQYCTQGKTVFTYNSKDVFHDNTNTYGGYANNIVLSEKFAIKVPANLPSPVLERIAPLLCAGISTYSPIMYSKVKKGDKVAVAGVGGLGHMALQYMVALGAKVTCFDIVEKRDACLKLGAKEFVNVKSPRFREFANTFDFIISTIPYHYDVSAYHKMLKFGGELAIVGLPASNDKPKLDFDDIVWNFQNKKVYSSVIGGIKETQEMLNFSIRHRIFPKVQVIPIRQLDEAYKVVAAGKADFRFVINMRSIDLDSIK